MIPKARIAPLLTVVQVSTTVRMSTKDCARQYIERWPLAVAAGKTDFFNRNAFGMPVAPDAPSFGDSMGGVVGKRQRNNQRVKEGKHKMLVLSRKASEQIVIGKHVIVTVSRIWSNRVQLAIDAPQGIHVLRSELKLVDRDVVSADDHVEIEATNTVLECEEQIDERKNPMPLPVLVRRLRTVLVLESSELTDPWTQSSRSTSTAILSTRTRYERGTRVTPVTNLSYYRLF